MTLAKHKTEKTVFDRFTVSILRKLESEGFFDTEALQPLALGKEANVFLGKGKHGIVVVKVYRLETCDFLKMCQYLRQDTRMRSIKRKRRDIIFAWVQREYRNLLKAREGHITVPKPITVKQNVLVMEYVDAEKVKDTPPKSPQKFYDSLIKQVNKLLKAGIVHADLSQFNVLNYKEKPVLIDFSQSLAKDSPHADEYLARDIHNIDTYFRKIHKRLKTQEVSL